MSDGKSKIGEAAERPESKTLADVTVTLSGDEAWLVYDLLIARADNLVAKEEEAMMGLGSMTYGTPARKVRVAISKALALTQTAVSRS